MYTVPLGKGVIRRSGSDVTVVAVSHLVAEAWEAAEELAREGIAVEIVDPRSLRPLDDELILESVGRTRRLVVADTGWITGGVTAEIAARVSARAFGTLAAPVERVGCPDFPTPAGHSLEAAYYVGRREIVAAVRRTLENRTGHAATRRAPREE